MQKLGKYKLKLLSLITALALLLPTIPTNVFAKEDFSQWYMPHNQESYITQEGVVVPPLDMSYLSAPTSSKAQSLPPASYDLRDENAVMPVQNQNPHGTCWSFSSLASMESGMIKEGEITYETAQSLSRRDIPYFVYNGDKQTGLTAGDYYYLEDGMDPYNKGGNACMSIAEMTRGNGAVTDETAPYNEIPYSIQNQQIVVDQQADSDFMEPLRQQHDAATLENAYFLPNDLNTIKQVLMNNGAIYALYYHDNQFYQPDNNPNEQKSAYNCNVEETGTNHAITIVGWDDSFSKTNFPAGHQPSQDGAWLVQYSWGSSWGDNGYFWISYEDASLDSFTFLDGTTQTNQYQYNYSYDGVGMVTQASFSTNALSAANVFTAQSDQTLDAVAFYTTDANMQYKIEVYKNLTNPNNPSSGELAATQTGSESYAGYYTIPLTTPVELEANSSFAVVITYSSKNIVTLPLEYQTYTTDLSGNPIYYSKVAVNSGETFLSFDGKTGWTDSTSIFKPSESNGFTSQVGNVCIKAFTNDAAPEDLNLSIEGEPIYGNTLKASVNEGIRGSVTYAVTQGDEYAQIDPITGQITTKGVGEVTIEATRAQEGSRPELKSSKTFTIQPRPIAISSFTATQDGKNTILTAQVDLNQLVNDDPLNGTIQFSNNGQLIGSKSIDSSGIVSYLWADAQPNTPYTLTASLFPANANYEGQGVQIDYTPTAPLLLTPVSTNCIQGSKLQFQAYLAGHQEPAENISYQLTGQSAQDTTISPTGFLSISLEETSPVLTVTAVSTQDPTLSAQITVAIVEKGDCNDDGVIDTLDKRMMYEAIANPDQAAPCCDLNLDSAIDQKDFELFLSILCQN